MLLLDTDTLSLLHAGHERVARQKEHVDPAEIATTIVTKGEILRARYEFLLKAADGDELLRAQHWLARSQELLDEMAIVPIDERAAAEFDTLRSRKELRYIGHADLLIAAIAAIALANRATLVTRNLRHFERVPGLKVENWVD